MRLVEYDFILFYFILFYFNNYNCVVVSLVNERFGFGVLDALALVKNAKSWNVSVPDQVICTMNVTDLLG